MTLQNYNLTKAKWLSLGQITFHILQ